MAGEGGVARARTESGLPIHPVYRAADLAGFDPAASLGEPGEYPFTRGVYPTMYTGRGWTMRQYAGLRHGPGVQPALSRAGRGRHRRAERRVRPAHPDGLRLRRPGRARRGRQGGRRDRLGRGHARALRRHPAGLRVHLDDDQRAGRRAAAALPVGRRGPGRARRATDRHDPERRAQGVHRPGHLHLPAEGVTAAGRRHLRLLPQHAAALEHDLDLRLPHGRGRRDAGAGDRLHPGQRQGLPRGPRRPPAWAWTRSARGCRSSSSPGPRCWRRWRSSGPPAGSGRGSCARSSARPTRARRCCASTPRPRACS